MMNVLQAVNGELLYITAPDGEIFEFTLDNAPSAYANLGTSAFNFITSQAYKQDGTSLVDQFAEERILTVDYQEICDNRQQWWDRRRELQAFFRPTRGGLFTLTLQQPERIFNIQVMPDPGLEFAGADISSLTILETIRFRAFSPFWSDADSSDVEFVEVTASELVFPITFPITFGPSGQVYSTGILNYLGSAKSYPILVVTGPYEVMSAVIYPQGKQIRLSVAVTDGSRIINPDPANPSIVDENGVSHFNELDIASDPLQDFAVLPEPPGNSQYIQITFIGGTAGVTTAAVLFNSKYIGI